MRSKEKHYGSIWSSMFSIAEASFSRPQAQKPACSAFGPEFEGSTALYHFFAPMIPGTVSD